MKPILFEIFGLPVASWYLFFALAGTSAYFLSRQLLIILNDRGDSISSEIQHHGILFSSGYVAGWFGARGMSIVREDFASQEFGNSLSSLFQLGSMTFYGGVVCATAVGIGLVFFYKLNLTKCLAAFVPAGVLALGIGRIGCFLNGDDFGKPLSDPKANPWWAHTTPWMEDQVLRYPTQLQEALFSIVLATLSYLTIKKQMKFRVFGRIVP